MITRCLDDNKIPEILDYVGDEFKKTPYLFANVKRYGCGTENIKLWIDEDEDKNLHGIYLFYYDCLHFFTRDNDTYPCQEVLDMIKELGPKVIMVQGPFGQRIEDQLEQDFMIERNHVIDMDKVGVDKNEFVSEVAGREDIAQVVDLLMNDPEYVEVYERDVLNAQMLDRYDGGFSTFFIVRKDDKVVASCSTYGEVDGFALLGGVIVHPEYRRRGYAADVENFACHYLNQNNISVVGFVNFNNTASLSLHEKLGAVAISTLFKFVRREK